VVGWAEPAGANQHAVLWQNGTVTDLDPANSFYSEAHGINMAGQIAGVVGLPNGHERAVEWQGGQMTDLGTLAGGSGTYSSASSINSAGQIVGRSIRPGGAPSGAFLWQDGKMTDLGSFGDEANSINDKTQVVGRATFPAVFSAHPFLWENGKLTDLGTLTGFAGDTEAFSINNNGQVVGFGSGTGFYGHAFVWQDGQIADLNAIVYGAADWIFAGATGINNLGQIAGWGARNGQPRGFLLTPLFPGSANGKLTLSNNSWTFSPHPVGQTSGTGTIYLTSSGTDNVHIQQIRVGALSPSDTPDDFKIVTNTCFAPGSQNLSEPVPVALTPGEFCAITFDFTALVAGGRTADIVVYDDTPDGPHAIPVNGVGIGKGVLVFSSTSWTFGGHALGQSSRPGTIYVYNSGTEAINFSSVAISGANAADYALTSNACSPTLAAHATCAASFVFTPSAPGGRFAALVFTDDSATSTQTVTLEGYGAAR
jgi:probable HAF family extracellular repeat protein